MAGIPQIKIVFDRRKKASAVNPGTVEIEVSYNRERVRLSTGVAVLKQQWNGKEVVNHPQADHLNEQIRRVYDGLHEKMSSIASTKGEYDLSLLK
ncbi:Arm DNA-binding domain-containing protein, partial [uncultured Muribaculum sp.]